MTDAAAQNDHRTLRCRKLGHEVPFSYCRRQPDGHACHSILNCWWEQFDVEDFLRRHMPGEVERILAAPPASRLATLVDVIRQARAAAGPDAAGRDEDTP